MGYDFEASSDELEITAQNISKYIDSVKESRDDIANAITALSTDGSWSGEASTTFVEKTKDYKGELENMTECLEKYVEIVKKASEEVITLNNKIKGACEGLG